MDTSRTLCMVADEASVHGGVAKQLWCSDCSLAEINSYQLVLFQIPVLVETIAQQTGVPWHDVDILGKNNLFLLFPLSTDQSVHLAKHQRVFLQA